MFRKLAYASLILASFATGAAQAAVTVQPSKVDCAKVEKDGGSPYEINVCDAQKFAKVDADLNKAYAELTDHFEKNRDTEAKMLLIKAQRAWITWRDAEGELCAQARGWSRGGSGYNAVVSTCTTELTHARTTSLINTLHEAQKH